MSDVITNQITNILADIRKNGIDPYTKHEKLVKDFLTKECLVPLKYHSFDNLNTYTRVLNVLAKTHIVEVNEEDVKKFNRFLAKWVKGNGNIAGQLLTKTENMLIYYERKLTRKYKRLLAEDNAVEIVHT